MPCKQGLPKGALYRHFKGKDELILNLFIFLKQELGEILSGVDPFLEAEAAFKEVFKSQLHYFHQYPHFLSLVFYNYSWSNERLDKQMLGLQNIMYNDLLSIVESGQKKEVFTTILSSEKMVDIAIGYFRLEMGKQLLNPTTLKPIEQQNVTNRSIVIII